MTTPTTDHLTGPQSGRTRPLCWLRSLAVLFILLLWTLAGSPLQAANLLQNGDFNQSLAGTWTTWTYGGGWAGASTNPSETYDGTAFIYMGANDGGGAGMYQVLSGVPGVPYTLSCASAVNAWWWPAAEMRLIFLDSNDATLLQTNYNCAAAITGNDIGLPWGQYSFAVLSPAGTAKVKVEFACPAGHGTIRFDNAVLTAPLVYPEITSVYPDGSTLMQATNTFAFTASSSATPINDTGIQVAVNGVNVSANLAITGSATSKAVTYSGITSNRTYNVTIQVTDTAGLTTSKTVSFDTFDAKYYTWEAEDYDYNGGLYIDNPQTNAYYGLSGVQDVDYHDVSSTTGNHDYRLYDLAGTEATTDMRRAQYAGTNDYSVGWFDQGEWLNYTRTFPAGVYNVYARMSSPGISTLNLSRVTSGRGTTTQTTESLGNFVLENGLGWSTYSWVPLTDASGNLVKLSLGGLATLRATAGGNANAQFFMLVPANTSLPTISGIYPDGATLLQATNTLRFTAGSAAGINPSSILVTLNLTNAVRGFTTNLTSTNGLTITGTQTSRTVTYAGLLPNSLCSAVITVTDMNNNTVSVNPRFDTYQPVLTWEAEDWDYEGGKFLDNPAVDAYANLMGSESIDFHDLAGTGNHPYRPADTMSADLSGDTLRTQYVAANTNDYAVGYFTVGEWINYTRTFPAGTYNVYGRFSAGGDTGFETLGVVTNGVGTYDQGVQTLGTFTIANTGGWGTYRYVPLRDEFGNLAQVTLTGKTTLRVLRTSGADANNNFFMLLPAETGLPTITQVSPLGFMQSTNKLTFVASSLAGIATSNVLVTLNGAAATVTCSGSATRWTVTCPLALNTEYTAVLKVIDNNGLVATTTVKFDTFSASNYMWEAEDWDYNSGQFFDNPQTGSYAQLAGVDGVDFHDTANGGNPTYRPDAVATEKCDDMVRPAYNGTGATDYDMGYTATGEWENYTRTYPTGTFNVYLRAARGSDGNATMGLAKVTSGWGTANQTTVSLGAFTLGNTGGWQNYAWVPLKDSNGNLATVTLGGTNTLRLTDGGMNVNFFALTPPAAAPVRLSAALTGANLALSFPTQTGFKYQVYYKNDLADSTWTLLTTVTGDGSVKSVSETTAGGKRFYRLVIQ